MTKKHYIQIAAILAAQYADATSADARDTINRIVIDLGIMFKAENPRFDGGRFLDFYHAKRTTGGS